MRSDHRDIEVNGTVRIVSGDRSFEVDLDPDRPCFVTPDGVEVWTKRPKGQRTWFVDADGNQVGPVHRNLVPAHVWARANGWRDPTAPDWWNDACAREIAAGGAPDDRHRDAGAWTKDDARQLAAIRERIAAEAAETYAADPEQSGGNKMDSPTPPACHREPGDIRGATDATGLPRAAS